MMRHALSTRLWHWLNALCLIGLVMSGLTISNAHRWLYWGEAGFAAEEAWTAVPRFPDWMTIPGYYNLALARDWHNLLAWPFALGLLAIWLAMLLNGHFRRDIATRLAQWRDGTLTHELRQYVRMEKHALATPGRYGLIQRIAYGGVFGILLPGMVLTGIAISPGMGPSFGWIADLVGGRQSARSLHFIIAALLTGFTIGHIVLAFAAGPRRMIGAMLTGRSADEA